jgi:hypothetical protein
VPRPARPWIQPSRQTFTAAIHFFVHGKAVGYQVPVSVGCYCQLRSGHTLICTNGHETSKTKDISRHRDRLALVGPNKSTCTTPSPPARALKCLRSMDLPELRQIFLDIMTICGEKNTPAARGPRKNSIDLATKWYWYQWMRPHDCTSVLCFLPP